MSGDIKDITMKDLEAFENQLQRVPASEVLGRAVQQNGIISSCKNYAVRRQLNRTFSTEIETGKVTAQKKSGRCWLFATLNTLRHEFSKRYHIKDFQFSQNYISFFDRLEKANKYLEEALRLSEHPDDDREWLEVLAMNDDDGGQWANAVALIQKYGLVPQSVMPETFTSNQTDDLNRTLNLKLSKDALTLRKMKQQRYDDKEINSKKKDMLGEVYQMLVYAFGKPPVSFDFEYRDDDKNYHIDRHLTPKTFFEKYVDFKFEDYVCLLDAPDHEINKKFGLPSQDYIYGGRHIEFLHTGLPAMKQAVIDMLNNGETVWFACDVLEDLDRDEGILSSEFFKQGDLFEIDLEMTKKDRLISRHATVSHAMTFTGVDIVEGKPTKWKVENSWGDKIGDNGYFIMTDDWFDRYVYEVIVNKQYLEDNILKIDEQEVENLPIWDSIR